MKEEVFKSLEESSPEELEALLTELRDDEARLLKLEENNPELAALSTDAGLEVEKYKTWQSIRALPGVQRRIKDIIAELEKRQK